MEVLKLNSWEIKFWPGGWGRATDDRGVTVVLRFLPAGEGDALQLRLHTALMTSSGPITARMWRDVPLAVIEQNLALARRIRPEDYVSLTEPSEIEGFSLEGLERYFAETPPLPMGHWIPTDLLLAEEGEPTPNFHLGLKRPPGGRITDEFLENVAEMYRWAVEQGEAPAVSISGVAEVPVRTVHRWISEARKRGFLPPAVKGKAG